MTGSGLGLQIPEIPWQFNDLTAWEVTPNDLRAQGVIWERKLTKSVDKFYNLGAWVLSWNDSRAWE